RTGGDPRNARRARRAARANPARRSPDSRSDRRGARALRFRPGRAGPPRRRFPGEPAPAPPRTAGSSGRPDPSPAGKGTRARQARHARRRSDALARLPKRADALRAETPVPWLAPLATRAATLVEDRPLNVRSQILRSGLERRGPARHSP